MEDHRINSMARLILTVIIFIAAFFQLLRPIIDLDFFWHLKTGEWIWQNKSLPSEDPFAFTTAKINSSRAHFMLTSYWLSQLIYYLFYLSGGWYGVVFLRFIICGVLIYIMVKREQGNSVLYISLLAIFLMHFLNMYPLDRPQVFSFLFFTVLLYLIEKIKANNAIGVTPYTLSPKVGIHFLLPLLMLIWANIHAGHVLGQVIIILYIAMEGIKFIHPALNPMKKDVYLRMVIAGVLGILFSFANPNTYRVLIEMINTPPMLHKTIENLSSIDFLRRYNHYTILLYWFILLLTVVGLILNLKKIDITEIALLGGIGFFSFTQVRYMVFFMIAALPIISRLLSKENIVKFSRILVVAVALYTSVFFAWNGRTNIKNIASGNWISSDVLPVNAAEFIILNDIKGNMYNYYDWGGYLIWRLAPERRVFIDGRNIYPDIFIQSLFIDRTYSKRKIAGLPFWKSTLNAYNIRYIVIPIFELSGQTLPLLSALLEDKDWLPVFFFKNSMIFVKDSSENYHVIRKYSIPKDYFINDLINECNRMIWSNPKSVFLYIAKGDLYLINGKFKEARETYEIAINLAPLNPIAKQRLKSLNIRKNF